SPAAAGCYLAATAGGTAELPEGARSMPGRARLHREIGEWYAQTPRNAWHAAERSDGMGRPGAASTRDRLFLSSRQREGVRERHGLLGIRRRTSRCGLELLAVARIAARHGQVAANAATEVSRVGDQ